VLSNYCFAKVFGFVAFCGVLVFEVPGFVGRATKGGKIQPGKRGEIFGWQ
jgi:hypothetical protein